MDFIYKLKGIKEVNISALARSADIKPMKLIQAVNKHEYRPGRVRMLSKKEIGNLILAIKKLDTKVQKLVISSEL